MLMGNSGIPNLSPLKRKPTASRSAGGRPPKRQASGNPQHARASISSVSSLTDRVQRLPSLSTHQTSPELGQLSSLLATPILRQTEDESSAGHSLTWQPFPEPTRSPTPPASTSGFRPGDEEVVHTPAGHPPAQLPSACVQPGLLRIQFRQVVRVLNPK